LNSASLILSILRDPLDAPGKAESVEWTPRRKAKVAIMTAPAMAPFQVSEVVPGADLTTDDEIPDWVKQAAETTYHPVATAGSARGFRTSSLLTLHWMEPDSNHRSRSYDQYPNGLKKAPELCAHGQARCVRTREVRGRSRYPVRFSRSNQIYQ
jgi:hypothetical protein